jgi:hypothetical protein
VSLQDRRVLRSVGLEVSEHVDALHLLAQLIAAPIQTRYEPS